MSSESTHLYEPPVSVRPSRPSRSQRILACVLCQQRKVKCDRKYPCTNCIRFRAECVPATHVSRPRKRRYPERELLERLRIYENLLRQNKINFEPLRSESVGGKRSPHRDDSNTLDDGTPKDAREDLPSSSAPINQGGKFEANNVWHAMSKEFRTLDNDSDSSDDAFRGVAAKKAWDQTGDDQFLFGSPKTAVPVCTLHPDPVHIFRLWQLYIDNVNPLFKVTHIPSLQGRIIEATSDVSNIKPSLEALMFSIYCMAVLTVASDDCHAIFGSAKEDLLTRYQLGCQQALSNCEFLRSSDRDCLTTLYHYLVAIRPNIIPQSLCSMLGVAIRIAQRMGIHSESTLAKCTVFEAEMRRRLWWSLVLFDARMCELADFKPTTLLPIWDCRIPLNVNDSDLRPEMKELPQTVTTFTDALFVVVRGELGDYVRHTLFHLDFTVPALKSIVKRTRLDSTSHDSEIIGLEQMVEDKYLNCCDLQNPLHFFTVWTTRGYLAKCRLMEYHFRYPGWSIAEAEAHKAVAISSAISMLQCDTELLTSPLTKGYRWLTENYWPFPAYLYLLQTLKQDPVSTQAEDFWKVMSDNFQARDSPLYNNENPFFQIFARIVFQAWKAREEALNEAGGSPVVPRIVASFKERTNPLVQGAQSHDAEEQDKVPEIDAVAGMDVDDFPMLMLMGVKNSNMRYGTRAQDGSSVPGHVAYQDKLGISPAEAYINQVDWPAMDWDLGDVAPGELGGPLGTPLSRPLPARIAPLGSHMDEETM